MRIVYLITISAIGLIACRNNDDLLIKPRQYPKVDFPIKEYKTFDEADCDFSFDLPHYASVEKKDLYFDKSPVHPCWFDITYTPFNGKLHCSYYPVQGRDQLDELIGDAFELVSKHHIKANFREELLIQRGDVSGLLFDISGPVASPNIFFLTDSLNHFFIASLYFESKVNPDSMKVVHDFIRTDLIQLIESFEWVAE